jgi:hypothetical protein
MPSVVGGAVVIRGVVISSVVMSGVVVSGVVVSGFIRRCGTMAMAMVSASAVVSAVTSTAST